MDSARSPARKGKLACAALAMMAMYTNVFTQCQPTFKDHERNFTWGQPIKDLHTSLCTTDIMLWSDLRIPARHIMSISGHVNEQSLPS